MKRMTEEGGYALLMVMMLMMLFTIIGLGLLATNINASKQSSMKEDQVQARHYAEMGVIHFKAELKRKLVEHNNSLKEIDRIDQNASRDLEKLNKNFCKEIRGLEGEDTKYKVEVNQNNGKLSNCGNGVLPLTFLIESTGIAGAEEKTESRIEVEINFVEKPPLPPALPIEPSPEAGDDVKDVFPSNINNCSESGNGNGNGKESGNVCELLILEDFFLLKSGGEISKAAVYIRNSLVTNNFTFTNGNNQNTDETNVDLIVAKDFYIRNELEFGTHSCVSVHENLTVKNPIRFNAHGYIYVYEDARLPKEIEMQRNHSGLFIYGDAYLPIDYKYDPSGNVFVSGDVYYGTGDNMEHYIKANPKPFEDVPEDPPGSNFCDPKEPIDIPIWEMGNDLNIKYL